MQRLGTESTLTALKGGAPGEQLSGELVERIQMLAGAASGLPQIHFDNFVQPLQGWHLFHVLRQKQRGFLAAGALAQHLGKFHYQQAGGCGKAGLQQEREHVVFAPQRLIAPLQVV